MADEPARPGLWHPRYWPTWIGVGVMRLLSPLPLEALLALGRGLGRMGFFLCARRRGTLRNFELCFPDLDERARLRLARECYESLGMGLCEAMFSYWAPQSWFRARYTLEGWEHIEAAHAAKRGILLLSVHAHTMEIGGCIALWHVPLGRFYLNPKNPGVTP